MRLRIAALAASVCAVTAWCAAPAGATTCASTPVYPGDAAPAVSIAAWMATGATAAALPGELPVMAALVESGLKNLNYGDADSLGYFQMRTSIWAARYPGYPSNPPLQLQWFVDTATQVRTAAIKAGDTAYGTDPATWGEWIADVERPAAQYRGRYQLRLADAQALVVAGCVPGAAQPPGTALPGATLADPGPSVRLNGPLRQAAATRGSILVQVTCPAVACSASARATIALPGAAAVHRIAAKRRALRRGQRGNLRLAIGPKVRRSIARVLHRGRRVRAVVVVSVADAAGRRTSATRTITLRRAP